MPTSRVEDLPRLPQDADGPVFAENAANQTMTRHTTTSTGLPRWRVW